MLAYAAKKRWHPLRIHGGTQEWQQAARMAALEAGFELADDHSIKARDALGGPSMPSHSL